MCVCVCVWRGRGEDDRIGEIEDKLEIGKNG